MVRLGLALPDELRDTPLEETVAFARRAEANGFDAVWKGETAGSNAFAVLSAVARETTSVRLGTGVANVFSRTPTLLGMSAATLADLSNGRFTLGIGVSAPPLVESWHGMSFERPLRRTRETIEIVRQVLAGDRVEYRGEVFDLGPYSVALDGPHEVPIFNAATGDTNRRLTGEYADGWLPVFVPRTHLADQRESVIEAAREAGRDPDAVTVVPWAPTAVAADPERAEQLAREHLAQEMAMGYNRVVRKYGHGASADEAHERWRDGDRDAAADAISASMLDEFTIFGTPSDCRREIGNYEAAGADELVLWPPVTATSEDLEYLLEALGPEGERA